MQEIRENPVRVPGTSPKGHAGLNIIINAIAEFFFPSVCLVCEKDTRNLPLCDECLAAVQIVERHFCQLCGQPIPRSRHSPLCPECVHNPLSLTRIRAWARFTYPVDTLVYTFKYNRRRSLACFFSRRLASLIQSDALLKSADTIVPIPLHPLKRWWRSYNQSALLAHALAKDTGIKLSCLLKRHRMTRTQTRLNARARRKNVEGAFSLKRGIDLTTISGARLILLDDVITTGFTLDAAAEVLLDAGAAEVYGLTVAGAWRKR